MKRILSQEEKETLENIYQTYLNDPKVMRMKDISMHNGSCCYNHSFLVTKYAMRKAIRYHKPLDLEAILIASIFHDYYLYDWRKNRELLKKHGHNHPGIANENAIRDFNIPEKASNIILSHMWPINIKKYPKTREAKIVSISDKAIAFREMFTSKKYKQKHKVKIEKKINKLFDN